MCKDTGTRLFLSTVYSRKRSSLNVLKGLVKLGYITYHMAVKSNGVNLRELTAKVSMMYPYLKNAGSGTEWTEWSHFKL